MDGWMERLPRCCGLAELTLMLWIVKCVCLLVGKGGGGVQIVNSTVAAAANQPCDD